jgi:hypothetical protein
MLLALTLIFAMQGGGEFYALYESGLEKLNRKEFSAAVQDLEAAVALRPESSETARPYGVRLVPYFPYHNLAYAYLVLKDSDKAEAYLKLAYDNKENEAKDPIVGARITMIETMLENFGDEQTQATEAPVETEPQPKLAPIISLLLSDEPAAALAEIRRQMARFPDNDSLPMFRDLTKAWDDTRREQERLKQDKLEFQRKIENLALLAEESEAKDQLERALQLNIAIRQLDPGNRYATDAVVRLRAILAERGRTEEQIQESFLEAQQMIARLEEEKAGLERNEQRLTIQNDDLFARLEEYQRQRLVPPPTVNVSWNVVPLSQGRKAHIGAEISSNVPLKSAELLINGNPHQSWEIDGDVTFRPPVLSNLAFDKFSNDLTLNIVDQEDNRYKEEFPLNFPPPRPLLGPFTKQILIWSTVAVIASYFAVRVMRRRRAIRERFNPYIAGAPVLNERMFYGRNQLLKQILNTLHNNSLMIYGERRIGKTSFLHRLDTVLQDLDDQEYVFIPVFIDLQGVREEDFFKVLDQEIASVVENRGIELEPEDTVDSRKFISRLRKTIKLLKESIEVKKPKLVLLLDEVDVMNGYSEHTNQQLRSVFMKGFADHIVAVMAGIHINKRWKSEGSPWYNFFEQIELKEFSKNHADALITRPVEGVYYYTHDAVEEIMEITGGKPYLIQKMCLNLVAHILGRNQRKITGKDVRDVFKEIESEFYGAT